MSEVKLSVSMDVSQAEAAAAALPDSIDRKLRSKKRGDFTQGYTDISAKGTKFIDPKDAMSRTANDLKMAQEAERKKQQSINETTSSADEWLKKFGKELGKTLLGSLGLFAVGMKVVETVTQQIEDNYQKTKNFFTSRASSGVPGGQYFGAENIGAISSIDKDKMSEMVNTAFRASMESERNTNFQASRAFEYFGYKGDESNPDKLNFRDLLTRMSRKYGESGSTQLYEEHAKALLGNNYEEIRKFIALKSAPTQLAALPDSRAYDKELAYSAAANYNQYEFSQLSQREAMGGGLGRTPQMLSGVTSLQAMGGGDVLSALARGPQDKIVDNTQRTADASEALLQWYESTMGESQTGIVLK